MPTAQELNTTIGNGRLESAPSGRTEGALDGRQLEKGHSRIYSRRS